MQKESRILEALEKVSNRLDPPNHYSLTLSGKTCDLQQTLSKSIKLDSNKRAEVALKSLSTYYSFPNINGTNNRIDIKKPGVEGDPTFLLPAGCYDLASIQTFLGSMVFDCRLSKVVESCHYFESWVRN